MRTAKVDYQKVASAALQILVTGEYPSAARVRKQLGDIGSPNTIHEHLTAWREQIGKRQTFLLPPDIPEELLPSINTIWQHALKLAEAAYEPFRAASTEKVLSAEKERDNALLARERATVALSDLEASLAAKNQEVIELAADKRNVEEELRHERANRARDAEKAQDREKELRAALAVAEDRHRINCANLESQISQLKAELELQHARLSRQEAHWVKELGNTRDDAKAQLRAANDLTARADSDRAKAELLARTLTEKLATAVGTEAALRLKIATLEGALNAEREHLTLLESQRAEAQSQFNSATSRLESLSSDLALMIAERDQANVKLNEERSTSALLREQIEKLASTDRSLTAASKVE